MTEEKFTVLFESQFSVGSNELVFQVKVRPGSPSPCGLPGWLGKARDLNPHTGSVQLPRDALRKPNVTLLVPLCEVLIPHQPAEFRQWAKKKCVVFFVCFWFRFAGRGLRNEGWGSPPRGGQDGGHMPSPLIPWIPVDPVPSCGCHCPWQPGPQCYCHRAMGQCLC